MVNRRHRRALVVLAPLVLAAPAALLASDAAAAPADPAAAPAPARLVLTMTNETWQSMRGPWLELIYRDAFRRIGYEIEIRSYPNMRATAMVESGQADVEVHRVAVFAQGHPTLVRVGEAHFSGVLSAYAASDITLKPGWQGFGNTPLRIEYRAGTYVSSVLLPKLVPAGQLSSVTSTALGLRKLLAGRTDIFVDNEFAVDGALETPEFHASRIRRVAQIERFEAYAYLHPRHRALAPRLAAALAEMKKEGVIEHYRQQAAALPVPQTPAE